MNPQQDQWVEEDFMKKHKGFTLVELLIVMSVVAILVAMIIPSFRGMQQEAWMTKADKEVLTLKTAIESYYRHHGSYPTNITTDLTSAQPAIITRALTDPWKTNGDTYGYMTGNMPGFGDYYIVYSKSINGQKDFQDPSTPTLTQTGDDIVESNLPIVKG
jgi:type IV pilus assembly protein PilA